MFASKYRKPMKPNHYTEIPPSFEINLEVLTDYDVHRHISARGIKMIRPNDFDVSAILKVSIKQISITGSIDFIVKVLKSTKLEGEELYEIHANFYDTNGEKEDEVLGFFKSF
jgi:hypothetical protein